ncbi:MAG TPA: LapA family protein [Candidatus Paceibacterota bacterium]|nr:LapA family protein [Candidatus Paceibacterota bacterium]
MTLVSLLAGIVLGAIAVIFILQNVAAVTVSFLGLQFTASLALVLLTTLLAGLITALLLLVPSLMRDLMYLGRLKRENKALEDELAALRKTVNAIPEAVTTVVAEVPAQY